VLYFKFLKFMAVLMFICSLVYIAPFMLYSSGDALRRSQTGTATGAQWPAG
jgi:hypothetical protein